MFSIIKQFARTYPNATLVVLGLAFIILPELHSRAVFYAYSGIHYQNWTPHPLVVHLINLWWWAEHRTLFMVVAISVTVAGAILNHSRGALPHSHDIILNQDILDTPGTVGPFIQIRVCAPDGW